MTKLDAGLITPLPAFDSGSAAVWGSKRINPWPQSCLCLTWSGYPLNENNEYRKLLLVNRNEQFSNKAVPINAVAFWSVMWNYKDPLNDLLVADTALTQRWSDPHKVESRTTLLQYYEIWICSGLVKIKQNTAITCYCVVFIEFEYLIFGKQLLLAWLNKKARPADYQKSIAIL